jgi:hypothetical protein
VDPPVIERRVGARPGQVWPYPVMHRQRIDKELIWRLMRFRDEPESHPFETRIETTCAEIGAIDDLEPPGR